MKKLKLLLVTISLSTLSLANEYVVVSNKSMPELSLSQVKAIFLKKISFVDDLKVVPINLEARDELRLKFEKEVLKMSFLRLKSYWTSQHYLGHRPPVSMKSQGSVKAFIKNVNGSIGYINAVNFDESLKVIYRWSD